MGLQSLRVGCLLWCRSLVSCSPSRLSGSDFTILGTSHVRHGEEDPYRDQHVQDRADLSAYHLGTTLSARWWATSHAPCPSQAAARRYWAVRPSTSNAPSASAPKT